MEWIGERDWETDEVNVRERDGVKTNRQTDKECNRKRVRAGGRWCMGGGGSLAIKGEINKMKKYIFYWNVKDDFSWCCQNYWHAYPSTCSMLDYIK